MRDNPNFPPLVVFVVYDPETDAYMTARVSCGSGRHCTYWSKDVRRAKHYRDKRYAILAVHAIERDGCHGDGELEVRMLDEFVIRKNEDWIDLGLLKGHACYVGFDLSSSEDMTASGLELRMLEGGDGHAE